MTATANLANAWSQNAKVRWLVADALHRGYDAATIDLEIGIPGITRAVAGDAAVRPSGFANFDTALKQWLVSEAPSEGLRAWLSERNISPPEFYRWRKEYSTDA